MQEATLNTKMAELAWESIGCQGALVEHTTGICSKDTSDTEPNHLHSTIKKTLVNVVFSSCIRKLPLIVIRLF